MNVHTLTAEEVRLLKEEETAKVIEEAS